MKGSSGAFYFAVARLSLERLTVILAAPAYGDRQTYCCRAASVIRKQQGYYKLLILLLKFLTPCRVYALSEVSVLVLCYFLGQRVSWRLANKSPRGHSQDPQAYRS